MKRLLMIVALALVVSTLNASAQENQTRALKSAVGRAVFVIDEDRREWQGRLLRISADALEVESDAGIRTFKVENIRRIDADGDRVTDGALKGALFGAAMGLFAVFNGAPEVLVATTTAYGLLGLAIDAGCTSRHPVYNGSAVPRLDKTTTHSRSPTALQVSMKVRW
jgi:hypothetical protein